jgi:hypothetical protein
MRKEIRLYNAFFPIWFLVYVPWMWAITLPINFMIDSAVLLILLKCMKFENIKQIYKRSILKVWIFGFLSDLFGWGFLFASEAFKKYEWWNKNIVMGVTYNPFHSIYSLLYVLLAVLISGFFIFILNYYFSLNGFELDHRKKAKIAIGIAIITAPYLFLIPTGYPSYY